MFWTEIWKKYQCFYLKIFSFWRWYFLYIWIGMFSECRLVLVPRKCCASWLWHSQGILYFSIECDMWSGSAIFCAKNILQIALKWSASWKECFKKSILFIPTLYIIPKFVRMIIWQARNLCPRDDSQSVIMQDIVFGTSWSICLGYLFESPQRGDLNKYPNSMFCW